MRALKILVPLALVVGVVVAISTAGAADDDSTAPTWQHAVKFICGTSDSNTDTDRPVLSGVYATAINVHNPNAATVRGSGSGTSTSSSFSLGFRKKALVLYPPDLQIEARGEFPTRPGPWVRPPNLQSDWGFEIDCADIRAELIPDDDSRSEAPLIKGYVVIEAQSKLPLDVVVAYTHQGGEFGPIGAGAEQTTTASSVDEDIETVQPKKIRNG
ncbi:MAG TPA: hypothetical protein VF660_02745 [Actinomycetota bacterium]|jgi:hypothetical protein